MKRKSLHTRSVADRRGEIKLAGQSAAIIGISIILREANYCNLLVKKRFRVIIIFFWFVSMVVENRQEPLRGASS